MLITGHTLPNSNPTKTDSKLLWTKRPREHSPKAKNYVLNRLWFKPPLRKSLQVGQRSVQSRPRESGSIGLPKLVFLRRPEVKLTGVPADLLVKWQDTSKTKIRFYQTILTISNSKTKKPRKNRKGKQKTPNPRQYPRPHKRCVIIARNPVRSAMRSYSAPLVSMK